MSLWCAYSRLRLHFVHLRNNTWNESGLSRLWLCSWFPAHIVGCYKTSMNRQRISIPFIGVLHICLCSSALHDLIECHFTYWACITWRVSPLLDASKTKDMNTTVERSSVPFFYIVEANSASLFCAPSSASKLFRSSILLQRLGFNDELRLFLLTYYFRQVRFTFLRNLAVCDNFSHDIKVIKMTKSQINLNSS